MTLEEATTLLFCLHRDKSGGHERPHKPLLLLSIMDLIERGRITEARIPVSEELRATFNEYFPLVLQKNDAPTPQNPFYFLSREPFWNLVMRPDFSPIYTEGQPKRAPTWAGLQKKVAYAQLDPSLFQLLSQPLERELLREALIDQYFHNEKPALRLLIMHRSGSEQDPQLMLVAEDKAKPARDTAFRSLIRKIYSDTCAATGLRVRLKETALIEAAHLIPWDGHNDYARNGIALSPTYHTALDNHWIAPGLDALWHVSPLLDDQSDPKRHLRRLHGKSVRSPTPRYLKPAKEGLEYRMDTLLRS